MQELMWDLLVCPRDKELLHVDGERAFCSRGHRYSVIEGIPIMLLSEVEQTHIEGVRALAVAESGDISSLPKFDVAPDEIDPFVQRAIGATNGGLYQHLVGALTEYPIPQLRLSEGQGRLFLEIGSNWGRWVIAAARAGYRPIGIDPSLKSIRAARRVTRQLGIDAAFLVADGRFLPFPDSTFDQVFSYSVLQHLSKNNVGKALEEIQRVLRIGAVSLIQLPNAFGIRCLYHQLRRAFREPKEFEVRYWSPAEILSEFETRIGPSKLSVDGYFSLNVQPTDVHLMPRRYRALVNTSESLRRMSETIPLLIKLADSLYVKSERVS